MNPRERAHIKANEELATLALQRGAGGNGGGPEGTAFVNGGNSFASNAHLGTNNAFALFFKTNATDVVEITTAGNVIPLTDGTQDLGGAANHWATVWSRSFRSVGVTLAPGGSGLLINVLRFTSGGAIAQNAGDIAVDSDGTGTGGAGQATTFRNGAAQVLLNNGGNQIGAAITVGSSDAFATSLQAQGSVGVQVAPIAGGSNFVKVTPSTGSNVVKMETAGGGGNLEFLLQCKGNGGIQFAPGTDAVNIFRFMNAGGTQTPLSIDTTNIRVGIGVQTAPNATLHVSSTTNSTVMTVDGSVVGSMANILNNGNTDNANGLGIFFGNNTTSAGGAKAIGFLRQDATALGSVAQTAAGTGVVYNTTSDERMKNSITPSTLDALATLRKIPVSTYRFNDDKHQREHHGFIAQHLHAAIGDTVPNAVTPGNESEPWMVGYGELVPLLVKSVQELLAKVVVLEAAAKQKA
jgi:Chaperone of endosialidase